MNKLNLICMTILSMISTRCWADNSWHYDMNKCSLKIASLINDSSRHICETKDAYSEYRDTTVMGLIAIGYRISTLTLTFASDGGVETDFTYQFTNGKTVTYACGGGQISPPPCD